MPLTIPIAHDFICPWCWVGLIQAKRLGFEFDVAFDWRGYELFPEELEWPEGAATPPTQIDRPPTPTRFDFILLADGLQLPSAERPKRMRTHNAHEAVEFAKTQGRGDEMLERLYVAYWRQGQNINDVDALCAIWSEAGGEAGALREAVTAKKFKGEIIGFDDEAYSKGVYNVPTFFIGDKRYAEQPYVVLKKAVAEALDAS